MASLRKASQTKRTSRAKKTSPPRKTSRAKKAPAAKRTSRTSRANALPSGPVTIKYKLDNSSKFYLKNCELLVVACDPRNLYGRCDYRPEERAVFKGFRNFTFHTSLLKVTLPRDFKLEHGVIFAPKALENPDGSIYGFRNESAKEFGLRAANMLKENWVTVYQLQNYGSKPLTPQQFQQKLVKELKTLSWWPYGQQYAITDTVTTPYFDQFLSADLKKGLPWQYLNLQGKHNTIYVHASTCFESILDCWSYANMLFDKKNNLGVKLPANRKAPIAILGAGASGVLFANMLREKNYTNVQILEVTDRSDGKIHTIVKKEPFPPSWPKSTVCELGACYLSPAYDDFVTYLRPFLVGNERVSLSNDENFRAIATEGQFPGWTGVPKIMAQRDYVIQKAKHDLRAGSDAEAEALILADLVAYPTLREQLMGKASPMPVKQPQNTLDFLSKTFEQWLRDSGLLSLVGLFQYGYSVQGYGALTAAPAFYGMIWINRAVIDGLLAEIAGGKDAKAVVTAWTKGWGDVWKQMKAGMNITYNANVRKIKRQN